MARYRVYVLAKNYPPVLTYRGGVQVALEVVHERHNTWVFRARRLDGSGATCELARTYYGLRHLAAIMFEGGIASDKPGPDRAILDRLEADGFARHHYESRKG